MADVTGPCQHCVVGLYSECENPEIVTDYSPDTGETPRWIIPCIEKFNALEVEKVPGVGRDDGLRDPKDITDATSTGRKRAAMLLPIMTGQICDWAGLKWAGGGVQPIVGCRGNRLAQAKKNEELPPGIDSRGELHHGPDKAVLNNAVGRNLHAICSECHHRWHVLNDPFYETERPDAHLQWLPSYAYYPATLTERAEEYDHLLSEEWWATEKKDREVYPIDLPDKQFLLQPVEEGILSSSDNPFEEPLNPFTETEN